MTHRTCAECPELHAIAKGERARLETSHQPEGLEGLSERARINLESWARALIQTNTWPAGAVEMLAYAGALEKPDVVEALKAQFDRLEASRTEEDKKALLDMSKQLIASAQGHSPLERKQTL